MSDTQRLLTEIESAIKHTISTTKIGVAFSGGVDSTLLAKICSTMKYETTLLTIGFAESHDLLFASQVSKLLELPHHTLEIDPNTFGDISYHICKKIDSDNLSWQENGIAFYYTSKLAATLNLDTILTANGIDELFCGYNAYLQAFTQGESAILNMMDQKLTNELYMMKAIDTIVAEFGVRIYQPLLEDQFIKFARDIPISEKIHGSDDLYRKHIIRRLAKEIGVPDISCTKRKKALQYGTRIHKNLLRSRRTF